MMIVAVCIIVALGSLAGAVSVFVRGDIAEVGLDGLFLLVVCLLFAAAFGMVGAKMLLNLLRSRSAR